MAWRITLVAALLLPLSLRGTATSAAPAPMDLDVQVSAGSPLDWLGDLPQPVPSVDRTSLTKNSSRMTVVEEPPHVQATDVFSFARITTVDLIGEIPWTKLTNRDGFDQAYPPPVTDDVLWLALSVFLRKLLHPAQVNSTEAFEYLTYIGEPSLLAASMASNEPTLKNTIKKLREYVSRMPSTPPEYLKGETQHETMMLRLTWDDLTCAHPFSFNKKFAARISLLGDEAIPYVIKASRSSHSFLHRNAIVMLGRYKSADALRRLREIVANDVDPTSRIRAVDGLVRRRDSAAVDLFLLRLKSAHEQSLRLALIRGLGILGNQKAVAPIIAMGRSNTKDFDTTLTCLTALIRLGAKSSRELKMFLNAAESRNFTDPSPAYAPVIKDKPNLREEITRQLASVLRASAGVSTPEQVYKEVRKALKFKKQKDRRLAPRGLLDTFHPPVIYALLRFLSRSAEGRKLLTDLARSSREEITVRCHALIELARAKDENLVDNLIPFATLEEDQPVAETAFRILAVVSSEHAVIAGKMMMGQYHRSMTGAQKSVLSIVIRFMAARREIPVNRMVEIVEHEILALERPQGSPTAKQPHPRRRNQIDFASPVPFMEFLVIELGRRGGATANAMLRDVLFENSLPARAEAAVGLGIDRSPKSLPFLLESLNDKDPWVRLMAYRSLQYSLGKDHNCDWLYAEKGNRQEAIAQYKSWVDEKIK